MSRKNDPKRTCQVITTLTQDEYDKMQKQFKNTTCRSLSEFVRDRINRQPETVIYRNRSADEFLETAVDIKNQLIIIGRELALLPEEGKGGPATESLSVRLSGLERTMEDIKAKMIQIYEICRLI